MRAVSGKKITRLIAAVFLLFILSSCAFRPSSLHFINVGKGDALLVKSGNEGCLIDAGKASSGPRLSEYLLRNNISSLEYIFLTHPHPDHAGGALFLLPRMPVAHIFDNGQPVNKDEYFEAVYSSSVRGRKGYRRVLAGERFKLGCMVIEVIWPGRLRQDFSYNDNALAFMISGPGRFRALVLSDNSYAVEQQITRERDVRATLLKAAHHGYADASGEKFIAAVKPEIAVISGFSGPATDTVSRRFARHGARVLFTGSGRDIALELLPGGGYIIKEDCPPVPR